MAKRLETLEPGTPVYCGEELVGEVRGVYAEGKSLFAEYLAILWRSRADEILVPTGEVTSVSDGRVILQGTPEAYERSAAFDAQNTPTFRRLDT